MKRGWIFVKFLMVVTGVLIFIYLISPKLQKDIFHVRDLTTEANLSYIRTNLLRYFKENGKWPESLDELVPEYIKKLPREYLSSIKGSNKVINAENDAVFSSLRGPRLKGWIYGAYDKSKGEKFSHKVLPLSTTLADNSGDTSSW